MLKIDFKNIEMNFGKTQVLKNINLSIAPGEFVTFIGPSGCGKTTLLRILAGLLRQSQGEIFFDGREVSADSPMKRGIAMVFQSYALYPHLNVYNNIALGLKQMKLDKKTIQEKVDKTAKMLKISNLLKRYPSELSGGQRQRVAIGRAIAREPQVLLLDEPLSNLDAALRFSVRLEISKLHQEIQSTTIYVTHDQVEAMTLSDKIVLLNQGKVEQVGSPLELYLIPCNRFVAEFLGTPKINIIKAEYQPRSKNIIFPNHSAAHVKGSHNAKIPWKHGFSVSPVDDKNLLFGFRPEHASAQLVTKNSKKQGLQGKIISIENMGNEMILVVDYGQDEASPQFINLKVSGFKGFKVNDLVEVVLKGNGYLFDPLQDNRMISCPKDFYQKFK